MQGKKIVLWSVLSIILIAILAFVAMFSYFLWVQRYGDEDTKQRLATEYYGKFTNAPIGGRISKNTLEKKPSDYIHTYSPQKGNQDAPITILAFLDFECPFCREAHETFEEISRQYGPAVRIVFKHFPVTQLHPNARQAHLAAQCAQEQNKFWPYYEQLFVTKDLSETNLHFQTQQLGLDIPTFLSCYDSEKYSDEIDQDFQEGVDAGVRGTPTYFVNQTKVEGVTTKAQWDQLILQAFHSETEPTTP